MENRYIDTINNFFEEKKQNVWALDESDETYLIKFIESFSQLLKINNISSENKEILYAHLIHKIYESDKLYNNDKYKDNIYTYGLFIHNVQNDNGYSFIDQELIEAAFNYSRPYFKNGIMQYDEDDKPISEISFIEQILNTNNLNEQFEKLDPKLFSYLVEAYYEQNNATQSDENKEKLYIKLIEDFNTTALISSSLDDLKDINYKKSIIDKYKIILDSFDIEKILKSKQEEFGDLSKGLFIDELEVESGNKITQAERFRNIFLINYIGEKLGIDYKKELIKKYIEKIISVDISADDLADSKYKISIEKDSVIELLNELSINEILDSLKISKNEFVENLSIETLGKIGKSDVGYVEQIILEKINQEDRLFLETTYIKKILEAEKEPIFKFSEDKKDELIIYSGELQQVLKDKGHLSSLNISNYMKSSAVNLNLISQIKSSNLDLWIFLKNNNTDLYKKNVFEKTYDFIIDISNNKEKYLSLSKVFKELEINKDDIISNAVNKNHLNKILVNNEIYESLIEYITENDIESMLKENRNNKLIKKVMFNKIEELKNSNSEEIRKFMLDIDFTELSDKEKEKYVDYLKTQANKNKNNETNEELEKLYATYLKNKVDKELLGLTTIDFIYKKDFEGLILKTSQSEVSSFLEYLTDGDFQSIKDKSLTSINLIPGLDKFQILKSVISYSILENNNLLLEWVLENDLLEKKMSDSEQKNILLDIFNGTDNKLLKIIKSKDNAEIQEIVLNLLNKFKDDSLEIEENARLNILKSFVEESDYKNVGIYKKILNQIESFENLDSIEEILNNTENQTKLNTDAIGFVMLNNFKSASAAGSAKVIQSMVAWGNVLERANIPKVEKLEQLMENFIINKTSEDDLKEIKKESPSANLKKVLKRGTLKKLNQKYKNNKNYIKENKDTLEQVLEISLTGEEKGEELLLKIIKSEPDLAKEMSIDIWKNISIEKLKEELNINPLIFKEMPNILKSNIDLATIALQKDKSLFDSLPIEFITELKLTKENLEENLFEEFKPKGLRKFTAFIGMGDNQKQQRQSIINGQVKNQEDRSIDTSKIQELLWLSTDLSQENYDQIDRILMYKNNIEKFGYNNLLKSQFGALKDNLEVSIVEAITHYAALTEEAKNEITGYQQKTPRETFEETLDKIENNFKNSTDMIKNYSTTMLTRSSIVREMEIDVIAESAKLLQEFTVKKPDDVPDKLRV